MKFLVQFAQQLIDFKLQEFNSLLVLNGLDPAACYDRCAAPAAVRARALRTSTARHARLPVPPVPRR